MASSPSEYFSTSINIGNLIPSLDDIQNSALTLKSTVVDIVKGRNNTSGLAAHTVTFMQFDEWTSNNQTHYYLIIGTSTGFQVFLLHDSRDRESPRIAPSKQPTQSMSGSPALAPNSTSSPIINPLSPLLNPLSPLLNTSPHNSPSVGYGCMTPLPLYPFGIC